MTTAAPRIDAHHHLWRYTPSQYGWITETMHVLRRDFLPGDLRPLLEQAGLDGAVTVQARQSMAETEWLLQLAEEDAEEPRRIRGIVGWAPIAAPDFTDVLAPLLRGGKPHNGKLKGLRHVVQDEPDENYILDPAFNRGIRALRDTGLVYDILIHARHLLQTQRFVDAHPDQQFVLDHCAKPPVGSPALEPWASRIRELATRPHVCCKISGLATEADWQRWTPEDLEPYWRVVLEAFGPSRLLFGSDWPVALLATGYPRWVETVAAWTAPLSAEEQNAIWGGNAVRVYSL